MRSLFMKGHNTVLLKSSKKNLSAVRLTFTSYCYFTWLRDCYIQTQCCLISKHDPRLPGSKDSGAAPQERRRWGSTWRLSHRVWTHQADVGVHWQPPAKQLMSQLRLPPGGALWSKKGQRQSQGWTWGWSIGLPCMEQGWRPGLLWHWSKKASGRVKIRSWAYLYSLYGLYGYNRRRGWAGTFRTCSAFEAIALTWFCLRISFISLRVWDLVTKDK